MLSTRTRIILRTAASLGTVALVFGLAPSAFALEGSTPGSGIHIDISTGDGGGGFVSGIKIMLLMTALTFAPAIVLSMTSFTRIIIVLALLRQAVGVVQLPPGRVLVGLALFLTLFTMSPVIREIDKEALTPYQAGAIDDKQALEAALKPVRRFMLRHTREGDLTLFMHIMGEAKPKVAADVPTLAMVPAFMLSELKTAFQIGALLFIPFLVIDLVVASVLMSMGMMMLPPMTISLPLKLIVFVLVDGWGLVVSSLAQSFQV
jgi:flagellar biosynthetic protein FliP